MRAVRVSSSKLHQLAAVSRGFQQGCRFGEMMTCIGIVLVCLRVSAVHPPLDLTEGPARIAADPCLLDRSKVGHDPP